MRKLICDIKDIITSSPLRDKRRDEVLGKLRVLLLDEKRRHQQQLTIGTRDPVRELTLDVRAARLSAALKPIDAFTPREMGQVISLVSREFSVMARRLDTISEMLKHLPGGKDFRSTERLSWDEEISLRFDVLPYSFEWRPSKQIAMKHGLDITSPLLLLSARRFAEKINAMGFDINTQEFGIPKFYFKTEQDQVLGILSI